MIQKKFLLILFTVSMLVACNNEDSDNLGNKLEDAKTYINLSVSLPSLINTRSLPDDYNQDGTYEGNDLIETLDVYIESGDGSIQARRFTGTDIVMSGSTVSPSEPFLTTSGLKTIYVVLNDPSALGSTISADALIPMAGLAQITTVNSVDYDLITMTGKTNTVVDVLANIPVQDVITGVSNRFNIDVTRMASRVIVTINDNANANLEDEDGNVIGSVSDITYSVAQGTNQVYWLGKSDFTTWGSAFVPADVTEYNTQAPTYYDYSDLFLPEAIPYNPASIGGYKSLQGKFLFENTHTDGSGYVKGNTAYVLVRAKFTPLAGAIADGGTLAPDGTFYVGISNWLIYSSKAAAQTPPLGVTNQVVATYEGGKMLNYAWLNPDDVSAPVNSPVVRNNIYHINITGFKRLAYNYNPLYPDPDNPDPKPDPEDPDIPIDPTDPLTPQETYMNVDVTVLEWTVHSYDIEF